MSAKREYGSGAIEQRGPSRWLVSVDLGTDPSTGRRRRRRATIRGPRRDAQRALREMLAERDRGFDGTPADLTLGDWITRWLNRHHADRHISDVTHTRYGVAVTAHILPAIGSMRLRDLRPEHIADLKSTWVSGEATTVRGPQAPATVRTQLAILKQALEAGVQAELLPRNPAAHVKAPSLARVVEKRALTEAEIRDLLQAAEGTAYPVPLRFSLATGVRQGELLGLRWNDVDIDMGLVRIRQSLSRVGHAQFNEPKAHSRRTLELSPTTVALLKAHRVEQHEWRLQLGKLWTDYGLVFAANVGTPQSPRNLLRGFRRVLAKTKIESPETIVWHTLRHSAASHWLAAGVSVFEVSRRLGHSSTAITERVYAHLLPGGQEKSARALDHLLG